jgi:hypothetical protein
MINWEDPNNPVGFVPGTVTMLNGQLTVVGSHSYSQGGLITIFVSVTPTRFSWTTETPLGTAREGLAVAVGSDHNIYAFGGSGSTSDMSSAEVYSPGTNVWMPIAPMPTPRHYLAAASTKDGRIFVFGGIENNATLTTVEVYTLSTGTWSKATAMPVPRDHMAAVLGPDGNIYLIGGENSGGVLDTVDIYSPTMGSWSSGPHMHLARAAFGAALGSDSSIHVFGGFGPDADTGTSVEALPFSQGPLSWVTETNMPTSRAFLGAANGPDGRMYAIGGMNGTQALNTVEAFLPQGQTWTTAANMPTARIDPGTVLGPDGLVYAIGGSSHNSSLTNVEALNVPASAGIGQGAIRITRNSYLAAVFPGTGIWRSTNSGAFQNLLPFDAAQVAVDDLGEVFARFGSNGIWYTPSDQNHWKQLDARSANWLGVDGAGDLLADIPGSGISYFAAATLETGSPPTQLTAADASIITLDHDTGRFAAEFPGAGVWRCDPRLLPNNPWQQLLLGDNVADANLLRIDGHDNVVANFTGRGLWLYGATATDWQNLTSADAAMISMAENGELVAQFNGAGVWRYFQGNWQQLLPFDATLVSIDLNGNVTSEFSGHGVWQFQDQGGWRALTPGDASALEFDPAGNLFADFSGFGSWVFSAAAGWQRLTNMAPSTFGINV